MYVPSDFDVVVLTMDPEAVVASTQMWPNPSPRWPGSPVPLIAPPVWRAASIDVTVDPAVTSTGSPVAWVAWSLYHWVR